MDEELYEVEIRHETNYGESSSKRIFEDIQEMDEYINSYISGVEDVEELEPDEMNIFGDNYEVIKVISCEDELIIAFKINNKD